MPRPRSDIQERLLRSARRAFLAKGVDGSSLRDVAAHAGTNLGMIYYYFGTKDDLFLAVVEEVYAPFLADFERLFSNELPPAARLRRLYERVGAMSEVELQTIRLVLGETLRSRKRLERVIERFEKGHLPLILAMVRDGLIDGTFDAKRPPIVVMLCLMAIGGVPQLLWRVISARLGAAAPIGSEELSACLVEVALNGLAPATASGPVPRRRKA